MDYTNGILIFSTATDFVMLQTIIIYLQICQLSIEIAGKKKPGFMLQ